MTNTLTPPQPVRIPCGPDIAVTLNADETATFIVRGTLPIRVSAAQIETFTYQLDRQVGETR